MVKELVNVQDFQEIIANNITIIDFYADWCVPCKLFSPVLDRFEKKYQMIKFCKINSDNPDLSEIINACSINSLPTFCFFYNGAYITKVIGSDESLFEKTIQEMLKN